MRWRRRLVIGAMIALGSVALFTIREVWIAAFARPTVSIDSRRLLIKLWDRSQPAGEDGWSVVKALRAECDQEFKKLEAEADAAAPGDAERLWASRDLNALLVGDPRRPELERTRAMIRSLDSEAMKGIRRYRRFSGPLADDAHNQGTDSPALAETDVMAWQIPLARLHQSRVAAMRLAAIRGNRSEYFRALGEATALAHAAGAVPVAISYMMATSHSSRLFAEVRHEIVEHAVPTEWCRQLLDRFSVDASSPSPATALQGERIYILDIIQRTHAPSGFAGGRLLRTEYMKVCGEDPWSVRSKDDLLDGEDDPPLQWTANLRSWWLPTRERTESDLDTLFGGLAADAERSRKERVFDPMAFHESLPSRSILGEGPLGTLSETMTRILDRSDQLATEHSATRLLLALELHRAERGSYPDSLDALVPHALAGMPRDPFAPDGRFCYRRLAAPDEHGREYLLYSVGFDGLDNAGSPPASGAMHEAFLVEGAGSDWIANAPRPR